MRIRLLQVVAFREGGPRRFAETFEDLRMLIVGRVEVQPEADHEHGVRPKLGFDYLDPGLPRQSRKACWVPGKGRVMHGLKPRLDERAERRIRLNSAGHVGEKVQAPGARQFPVIARRDYQVEKRLHEGGVAQRCGCIGHGQSKSASMFLLMLSAT